MLTGSKVEYAQVIGERWRKKTQEREWAEKENLYNRLPRKNAMMWLIISGMC